MAALRAIEAELEEAADGGYACPICTSTFGEDALEARELTGEHVPPGSQGGRVIALTCWRCNNAGSRVDAAAATDERRMRMEAAFFGRGSAVEKGRVELAGRSLYVEIEARPGEIAITPLPGNDPRYLGDDGEFWGAPGAQGVPAGQSLQIVPNFRYDPRLARVGDLRTAYLAAFARFGYRYALDPRLTGVREQILHPTEQRLPAYWWSWISEREDPPAGPEMIYFGRPAPCIAVCLYPRLVFLPWVKGPTWEYPYPVPPPSPSAEATLSGGRPIPWPTTLEMSLDIHPTPGRSGGE